MSPTAIQEEEEAYQFAAEASHSKWKPEEAADHADAKVVKRKHGFDRDILDCPICMEPFSPPVYQCHNGHTACSACCKKLIKKRCPSCKLSTGSIRCMAVEKLVESLSVSCKYAPHGCHEMHKPSLIENHEANCVYEPFCCPECNYEATRDLLLWHLTGVHQIPTVVHNNSTGVSFRMEPSNRIVIVNVDVEDTRTIYLVHRDVHEHLGDIFFCTSFAGDDMATYNLRVRHRLGVSVPHSMESASAISLRCMEEYLQEDFLLVPAKAGREDYNDYQSFELDFKLLIATDED